MNISRKYFWYFVVLVVVIYTFIVGIFFYDKANDTKHGQPVHALAKWTTYDTVNTYTKTIVQGNIEISSDLGNILAFYSSHQNIEVYEGDELIYKYPIVNNNPISKTPGYSWNFVQLPKALNNIQVIFSSPYKDVSKKIPDFYIGNIASITSHIIDSSLFPFILCIVMFFLGLIMATYYIVIHKKNKMVNANMLYLGIFAVFLSIWSINECPLTILIMQNNIATSYLSFLSLMLLPMPFAIFVKNFYNDTNKNWDIFFKLNIGQIVLCIALQLVHAYDLRETLWTTHVIMVILIAIVFYRSYNLLINSKNTKMVKMHLLCMIICVTTLLLDLLGYYMNMWDSNSFGRIGFLAYIVVLGITSTNDTASLIQMGQQADAYQRLAYSDQMTGLFNRTCFNVDFAEHEKKPDDVAIIDFDLNHLKHTNDTYGHSAGDKYIKNSARIINEIFSSIGKCYRVGGDEFVAIVPDASTIDIKYYIAMLESSVDACGREPENKDLHMQISSGCAIYSADIDGSLEDTYKRADKIMYEDKKNKKGVRTD